MRLRWLLLVLHRTFSLKRKFICSTPPRHPSCTRFLEWKARYSIKHLSATRRLYVAFTLFATPFSIKAERRFVLCIDLFTLISQWKLKCCIFKHISSERDIKSKNELKIIYSPNTI